MATGFDACLRDEAAFEHLLHEETALEYECHDDIRRYETLNEAVDLLSLSTIVPNSRERYRSSTGLHSSLPIGEIAHEINGNILPKAFCDDEDDDLAPSDKLYVFESNNKDHDHLIIENCRELKQTLSTLDMKDDNFCKPIHATEFTLENHLEKVLSYCLKMTSSDFLSAPPVRHPLSSILTCHMQMSGFSGPVPLYDVTRSSKALLPECGSFKKKYFTIQRNKKGLKWKKFHTTNQTQEPTKVCETSIHRAFINEEPNFVKLSQPPQRRIEVNTQMQDEYSRAASFGSYDGRRFSAGAAARAGIYLLHRNIIRCYSCCRETRLEETDESSLGSGFCHFPDCDHIRRLSHSAVSTLQCDGRISDMVADPPGQQSVYIPPGDPRRESYRLTTFENFPSSSPASKEGLAKAGFLYTGFFDRVKCFACARTVEQWVATDNLDDMRWHKPDCPLAHGRECGNVPVNRIFNIFNQNSSSPTSRRTQQGREIIQQQNINNGAVTRTTRFPTDLPERMRRTGGIFEIRPGNTLVIQSGPAQISSSVNNTGNESHAPQPRRPWRMANVVSADHRRFLSNLYLNRELDRLTSFSRWPISRPNVSPAALARSGFFYLGDLDRTQCFSCGGVLRNWTLEDEPNEEHRTHFPSCEMMRNNEARNIPVPEQAETADERNRLYPCQYPANPHMRSEANRLGTFDHRWQIGRTRASAAQIAEAGFFFLGERDRVKCWYCNGGLQNWEYDDVPWAEHSKWFPHCQFLLQNKGQRFVFRHLALNPHLVRPIIARQQGSPLEQQRGQEEVERSGDIPPSGPIVRQPSPPPTIIDPQEEMRKKQERLDKIMANSEVVKTVLAFGYADRTVRQLLEEKIDAGTGANEDDVYDSVAALLDDVLKKEAELAQEETHRQTQPKETSGASNMFSFPSTVSSSYTSMGPASSISRPAVSGFHMVSGFDDDDDEEEKMDIYSHSEHAPVPVAVAEAEEKHGSHVPTDDPKSIQEMLSKIEDERMCKVCFSNNADMVFIPCSHMCCCMECTQALRQCPVCRVKIEKAIKTYSK